MANLQFQTICVPVDGSPAANAALEIAASIITSGGRLTLVNATNRAAMIVESTTPYGGDASDVLRVLEDDQKSLFAESQARCAALGVASKTIALDGPTGSAITDFLRENHFDAVVMGTNARRGLAHLLIGSTAEAVLRASQVPVFVTSEAEHSRLKHGIRSIVLAFDASEPAQAAAQFATAIAGDSNAELAFVHVRDDDNDREDAATDAMLRSCNTATRRHIHCQRVVLDGEPATVLATAAAARAADLIVIGTHGRSGLTLLRLGSVAASVIRNATVPVLAIPATAHVRLAAGQAS